MELLRRSPLLAAALLFGASPARVAAQAAPVEAPPSPPEALILERLQGLWEGEGTWLGAKGRGKLTITPVLEGRFTRLEYRVERVGVDPLSRFAGDAYYTIASGRLSGTWFDSDGYVYPLETRAEQGALVVDWGPPGDARGRTTYRRIDVVQLDVIDEVKGKDGSLREFARFRYQRK